MQTIDNLFHQIGKDFEQLKKLKLTENDLFVISKETEFITEFTLKTHFSSVKKIKLAGYDIVISDASSLEIERLEQYKQNNISNNKSKIIPKINDFISTVVYNEQYKEEFKTYLTNVAINCTQYVREEIQKKDFTFNNENLNIHLEKLLE